MDSRRPAEAYHPREDFVRVATATPQVAVGDVRTNLERIAALYREAASEHAALVVFPELSLTGYTIGDLVHRRALLDAARSALVDLARETAGAQCVAVVGLPLAVGNALYNVAAVVAEGEVRGLVPKQRLPTYNEFYEKRWYQTWGDRADAAVRIGEAEVPFGHRQLFEVAGALLGVEICEDLWVTHSPHETLADRGALLLANLSVSPETAAKAAYRRGLVDIAAGKAALGYVYVSADHSESTADVVMSGHALVNEAGRLLAERPPLRPRAPRLLVADVDVSRLRHERRRNTNQRNDVDVAVVPTGVRSTQEDLRREIDPTPFVPRGTPEQVAERLDTLLSVQALGLATRVGGLPRPRLVLGLSGGLDSTLALLVAVRAAEVLDMAPGDLVHTLTLPGRASSERTQGNAVRLAERLGVPNEEIPIAALADAQLAALGHGGTEDVTYENTQARLRQALVFNRANQLNALALGTGDLSETALGWCTYGGDQTSGYHVNASIPKTLVRSLVAHAAAALPPDARDIVDDILATPVSPELTGDGSGITQATEDIVGPYELHDFFLYHYLRWAEPVPKIEYLARQAFAGTYDADTVRRWLGEFVRRFYQSQWKRQTLPDGPKVGISLSPRADWRMPPDAVFAEPWD